MELIRNAKTEYGCLVGEVFSILFDQYIKFLADEAASIEYVAICANYLNSLPDQVIDWLCVASIRYCQATNREFGVPLMEFKHQRDVLDDIYLPTLGVPTPKNGDEPLIDMELNCTWEPEHGMHWVVRGDKVLYVSSFGAMLDPWEDFAKWRRRNYAVKTDDWPSQGRLL